MTQVPVEAALGARHLPNFSERPILVYWETTQACTLACRHCRASAQSQALPGELTYEQGCSLIDQIAEFGRPRPVLVLTGGDLMMRPDIYELTAYAKQRGLSVAITPSITPRLTKVAIDRFSELGVSVAAVSLDGAQPTTHDRIRGVNGHFDQTLASLRRLRRAGFKVQVNTTVMRDNVEELADIAALLLATGIRTWVVFFLVGVGRGAGERALSAAQSEDVCHFLYDAAAYGLVTRTVEGPFFRRVTAWRGHYGEGDPTEAFRLGELYSRLVSRLRAILGPPTERRVIPSIGTRDGKGVIFVSHDGQVHPSGFLPLVLGSVKHENLVQIYRQHPTLLEIRRGSFRGSCAKCGFKDLCGGSRARAFEQSGDPLADDPSCLYALAGARSG